jgi:hypothetical protein
VPVLLGGHGKTVSSDVAVPLLEQLHELAGQLMALARVFADQNLIRAFLDVRGQNDIGHASKRGADGAQLCDNVQQGAVIVQHALNSADLTGDSFQSSVELALVPKVHVVSVLFLLVPGLGRENKAKAIEQGTCLGRVAEMWPQFAHVLRTRDPHVNILRAVPCICAGHTRCRTSRSILFARLGTEDLRGRD